MKFLSKNLHIIIGVIILALVAFFVIRGIQNARQPGEFDAFTQCLTDSNVTYYGAFWCPNCQEQERLFGRSKRFINYVECSTPQRTQKAVCNEAGIEAYPTWDIDGFRVQGVQPLESLALATSCELPGFDQESAMMELESSLDEEMLELEVEMDN